MTVDVERPRMGRPPKITTEGGELPRERRRKDGESQNAGLRLDIPEWVYEKYPRATYRLAWIRDEAARVQQKHNEDWYPVEGVTPVPGASDRHGNPVNHLLHVKRMEFVLADRANKEAMRRAIEDQAVRGKVTGRGDDVGEALSENVSYADASNRLR